MSSVGFHLNEAELAREIEHVKELIKSYRTNMEVLSSIIARQGVANVDLHFRKAALEDDLAAADNRLRSLEARLGGLDISKSVQVAAEILYTHLPSGVLDLYDSSTMPILRYTITNNTAQSVTFFLSSEIEDYSFSLTDTVEVDQGMQRVAFQLPRLKADKAKELTDIRRAIVHTQARCLRDGREYMLLWQDFEVYLMARNVIRWAVPDVATGSSYKPLLEHIAAWVTPRTEPVQQMLRQAVEYSPRGAMWGYQGPRNPETVRSQVKAVYQALKLVGELAYVNSPFAIGPKSGEVRQAVRLPRESLTQRSANCIDGAVLYASLMEYAALEPVVVVMSGHAFVGWKTWRGADEYEFLETTVTLKEPFEKALQLGEEEYRKLEANGWFMREVFDPRGFARILDIKSLHEEGIYPME